ncbi:alpha/beta-hydrolase, partial [Ascodesmis nigricans]
MSSPSHPFASPLVHPTPAPTSALIFLHGRGDSSRNFLPLFTTTPISTPPHTLGGILSPKTRIVVPTCLPTHSPIYGTRYAVWFDMFHERGAWNGDYTAHQKHSIRACVSYLHSVIETEIASGIPASQIWVGGISQGMGAAMLTFLCGRWKLGGVVGLSGWVPFAADLVVEALSFIAPDLIPQDTSEDEKKQLDAAIDNVLATPVFLGHGTADRTLRYQIGRSVYTLFRVLGVKVEWRRYEGLGHWWRAPEEVDDMVEFMV